MTGLKRWLGWLYASYARRGTTAGCLSPPQKPGGVMHAGACWIVSLIGLMSFSSEGDPVSKNNVEAKT